MRDKSKNPFVPMSLGTSRTAIHVFSYETQGQDRDKLGTNRDKGQGTRIYRYAVPMSQRFRSAPSHPFPNTIVPRIVNLELGMQADPPRTPNCNSRANLPKK